MRVEASLGVAFRLQKNSFFEWQQAGKASMEKGEMKQNYTKMDQRGSCYYISWSKTVPKSTKGPHIISFVTSWTQVIRDHSVGQCRSLFMSRFLNQGQNTRSVVDAGFGCFKTKSKGIGSLLIEKEPKHSIDLKRIIGAGKKSELNLACFLWVYLQ